MIIGLCIVFAFAWLLSGCSTTDRDYTLYYRHADGDEAGMRVMIKPGTGKRSAGMDLSFDFDALEKWDLSKDK